MLPIQDARKNDEIISLADSQILRWIDEMNGIEGANEKAREIKSEIRRLRREDNSVVNRRAMKRLYNELDKLQFKPDYMCLIIDREKDYHRACRGFSINGVRYKRLLGTNGGIKNSTIVFVSERLSDALHERVDNGRDKCIPLVPAKLEAYKALTCSASIPVSLPNGVLVVQDCETEFEDDIISLNDEEEGEPIMRHLTNQVVKINASDGFGIMLPSLAARWSEELGLDYVVSGLNTRFAFEKGMVYTFDFLDFAEKVAGSRYIVKDAWGHDVDVREVELILTTSMVKLWESYSSCEAYIDTSLSNGYTFAVTKTCPKELEDERSTNYQFLQSYDLSDEDIDELITPTMNEIKDVLGGDWKKAILFLKGASLTEKTVRNLDDDFVKSIMIEPKVLDDPYVQGCIYQLIKNRINQAKVGVLKVHGNYSIASGDPYALCQSIFGLEVTGLLKAGEVYNKYWVDSDADYLACFRAPMSTHSNIRRVAVARSTITEYWYKHMRTCTVFNAWDCCMPSLNGMDFDGDLVMLTDNNILVNRLQPLPALFCVQRRAEKSIPQEEDFIRSNINSFGNDIGATTNKITSMFEVRSRFPKGSKEYETLSYRINCGQLFQQNAIDKAKGIICKPMPRSWFDRHAVNEIEDEDTKAFYRSIMADKKPYFMRYIYPDLMKQYNKYIRNTERNALREFQMSIDELSDLPVKDLTERQRDFLRYYYKRMPVGIHDCVMNKICRRFEDEFDGCIKRYKANTTFDSSVLKVGVEYSSSQYNSILHLYNSFNKQVQNYKVFAYYEGVEDEDISISIFNMREDFERDCMAICQNGETLLDILVDICYQRSNTKRFVWEMCRSEIVSNLLKKNNNIISFPALDLSGDIKYGGKNFSLHQIYLEEIE